MGGSVVSKSCPILLAGKYRVAGVSVLDVVEGSAIDALPHMNSVLNARPDGFHSMEEAIEWQYVITLRLYPRTLIESDSVVTNTIQNVHSARISIPGIIQHKEGVIPPFQWRTPLRSTASYWLSWSTFTSSVISLDAVCRLVPGIIEIVPGRSYSTPADIGGHRSSG